jgi:hypothetical protein
VLIVAGVSVRLHHLDGQDIECEELYTLPAATGHHYRFFTFPPEARPSDIPIEIEDYRQLLTPSPENGLREVIAPRRYAVKNVSVG